MNRPASYHRRNHNDPSASPFAARCSRSVRLIALLIVIGLSTDVDALSQKAQASKTPRGMMKLDTIRVEGFRPKDVLTIIEHPGTNPLLLDVRSRTEFAAGHLKGAMNIPLLELERRLASLKQYKKQTIITMCDKGVRGMQACGILVANGFAWTYYMKTGVDGWVKEGLPLTQE